MRCGISAGWLLDLQTRAAGLQTPAGDLFSIHFNIQIFLKRKARQTDGCRCETGCYFCVLSLCNSDPGSGVHADPGLNSAAPIRRVASVLTHGPVWSVFNVRSLAHLQRPDQQRRD